MALPMRNIKARDLMSYMYQRKIEASIMKLWNHFFILSNDGCVFFLR